MAIKLLDELSCKIAVTGKAQSFTAGFGSDILREIKEIDKQSIVGTLASGRPFVYMYNGRVPITVKCTSIGLSGYLVRLSEAEPGDTDKLTVYYKEE